MASTNIVTSDTSINQWSFDQVTGKLREALRNSIRSGKKPTLNNNQTALNATVDKTAPNRYSGSPAHILGATVPEPMQLRTAGPRRRRNGRREIERSTRRRKQRRR